MLPNEFTIQNEISYIFKIRSLVGEKRKKIREYLWNIPSLPGFFLPDDQG